MKAVRSDQVFDSHGTMIFWRKNMKNKKLLIAVIALVAVVAILLGVYFATREQPSEGDKTITVTVIHGDKKEKTVTYHTSEEYLGPVLLAEGLVEGEQAQYGLYIKVVDGEQAIYEIDNAYWSLYIGEEPATTGADLTPIHDGDTFKLVYTGA